MRSGISITLSTSDRTRLEAIVSNRNAPQKHVWRAQIVLLSADRIGTVEIMRRTGTSKTCVWRWQERFAEAGVDGLLRDKTRPSRVPPLGQEVIDKVVALTATEPQDEATHWTAAAMAKAVGISLSSGECPIFRVSSTVGHGSPSQRAETAKRSPNRMANWLMAAVHSTGRRQWTPAFWIAR